MQTAFQRSKSRSRVHPLHMLCHVGPGHCNIRTQSARVRLDTSVPLQVFRQVGSLASCIWTQAARVRLDARVSLHMQSQLKLPCSSI
jgi:hypothetical protein